MRLVRNSPGRVCGVSILHRLRLPSRTINPQQRKKTIIIRSIHGRPGQRNFIPVEKTKEPRAAASAPFAVARL